MKQRQDKWYYDNAQVADAIWEISLKHPGATQSEMLNYAKRRGIPRYYALCCLTHSSELSKIRDSKCVIHYYPKNRKEMEALYAEMEQLYSKVLHLENGHQVPNQGEQL